MMKTWLKGLVAAFIGGAASSLSALMADPTHFGDYKMLGKVALAGALTHLVMYLKKSPVPDA